MADVPTVQELLSLASVLDSEHWRQSSDAAQVLACYLAAHPHVASVRYPGLKTDPLFLEASQTLRSGFGPYVVFKTKDGRSERIDCSNISDIKDFILQIDARL